MNVIYSKCFIMGRLTAELHWLRRGDVAEGPLLRPHSLSDGSHPGPKRTARWTGQSKMVVRVDACCCCSHRLGEEMAATVMEMEAVSPQVFLSHESLAEGNAELMDE